MRHNALIASVTVLYSAGASAANTCPSNLAYNGVCIDAKKPLTPLPVAPAPAEMLKVRVMNKSPWEKIATPVGEAAPKDFAQLTQEVRGKGFAFAITYRFPF